MFSRLFSLNGVLHKFEQENNQELIAGRMIFLQIPKPQSKTAKGHFIQTYQTALSSHSHTSLLNHDRLSFTLFHDLKMLQIKKKYFEKPTDHISPGLLNTFDQRSLASSGIPLLGPM